MQTDNLELKKLVYLYLMNYAKSQPDMAIMAVNTFVKVSYFQYITFSMLLLLNKNIFKCSSKFENFQPRLFSCFLFSHGMVMI